VSDRRRLAGFDLVHLLLLVTIAELAINRLAVPALRPPGRTKPPMWHELLDHVGLFAMYFATMLAIGVLGYELYRQLNRREVFWKLPRYALAGVGVVFLALATVNTIVSPGESASFAFESCFTVMLALIVAGLAMRGGDVAAKIGIVFLAAPLIVHYYGPFALRFIEGQAAMWGDLPDRVQHLGQWSMVFAALVSPYCFAPRPFFRSAGRLAPLAIGAFVGIVGAVILRKHYEVGMLMASRGLGIDIGPAVPTTFMALYLMALGTITWTLTSCFIADSHARRDIGVGIALVVVGGYGFSWPLQYLVALIGLITIAEATSRVAAEETGIASRDATFSAPPISDEVWHAYVMAVVAALRGSSGGRGGKTNTVTSHPEEGVSTTHIVTERAGIPVRLRIDRVTESIVGIDIVCGREPGEADDPTWTLYARPERLLGVGAHPEPPEVDAPAKKTGDQPFDQRFRVRDPGVVTDRLMDDGLRARATALVDGWMAYWDHGGLRYRVYPGHGAPLDHPIPITELAFRGTGAPPAVERMVTLLDLLADISTRASGSDDDDDVVAEPQPISDDAFVEALFERLDDLARGNDADLQCVFESVMPLVFSDPDRAAELLRPMAEAVRQAVAEQARVLGDDGLPGLDLVGLVHLANAMECVGVPIGEPTMRTFDTWFLRFGVARNDTSVAAYWTTGFASLALGERLTYRARAGLGQGDDPTDFTPLETFGHNLQAFMAHLAGAKETGATADEVGPAWEHVLEHYPMYAEGKALDEGALLWMARIVHHDLGGEELGSVAHYLRERLPDAS
jgi:hypothetical protein